MCKVYYGEQYVHACFTSCYMPRYTMPQGASTQLFSVDMHTHHPIGLLIMIGIINYRMAMQCSLLVHDCHELE